MPYKDPQARHVYDRIYRKKNRSRINARHRASRAKNHERSLAYEASYRALHPELIRRTRKKYNDSHREQNAAYRRDHSTEISAYQVRYNTEHRQEKRVYHQSRYQTHRQEIIDKVNQWRKDNPDKFRAAIERRRARKANAAINDFTHAEWVAAQEAFDHRCAYCGRRAKGKLTQDHITALTKDGNHTLHNIVPACRSCNSKKGKGAVLKPVQPLLLVS